jgi:hypothetical protein
MAPGTTQPKTEISWSHRNIPGAKRITWIKFYTEDLQIPDTTVQNIVAWKIEGPGFVQTHAIR